MLGLALVAHEFILLTVGPTWEKCVPLLQILCIGGACLPLHTLYQNAIISNGRSDIYLRLVSIQIVLQIALTLGFSPFGITAMVAAFSMLNVLFTFCWHLALRSLRHVTITEMLKDTLPFALIAGVVMTAAHYLTTWTETLWLLLLLRLFIAAILYIGIMKLLHAKTLDECITFILKKRR